MIQTEILEDGHIHTWSDLNMKLRQIETDILYDDAVDVPNKYTYEETDVPIDSEEIEAEEALNILLGGACDEATQSQDYPDDD